MININCYDPPHFSPLPYPSSPGPELVSFKLEPVAKHATKPPVIFPSATPPESMGRQPLPLNPSVLSEPPPLPPSELLPLPEPIRPVTPQWTRPSQVVMPRSPSPAMSIYPPLDLPPVHYTEPPIVVPEQLLEDSPIEDAPTVYYLPDIPEGPIHTLHPERSPAAPWKEHYEDPIPSLIHKRSMSPTSPSSAPIRQRTSREGSYHSITPTALSPIAGTSSQSQDYQSTSSGGSADKPSPTQSSADDADSDMALNWVTINTDYLKG